MRAKCLNFATQGFPCWLAAFWAGGLAQQMGWSESKRQCGEQQTSVILLRSDRKGQEVIGSAVRVGRVTACSAR